MQFMPEISILADVTTGKLIQRYLNRESVEVESSPVGVGQEPVSLCIIDVSDFRGQITDVVSRMSVATGCGRYILITPMENPFLHGELASLRLQWQVSTIAKPIKLSELKVLVDHYTEEAPLPGRARNVNEEKRTL